MQYRRSQAPQGQGWTAPAVGFTPPEGAAGDVVFIGSDEAGWSAMGEQHQNPSRKRAYYRGLEVVDGEAAGPFVRSVIVGEAAANLVGNTPGHRRHRLYQRRSDRGAVPASEERIHRGAGGFAVGRGRDLAGSATMFDDAGPFGTAMVTSLANPAAQIDFAAGTTVEAPGPELFSR